MSEGAKKSQPKAEPPRQKEFLGGHLIEVIIALSIVVLIIAAFWSYNASLQAEDELSASVTPDPVETYAGETVALTGHAFFNDEPVLDWGNVTFEWTISNASLGTLNVQSPNIAYFTAGNEPGEGTITCDVTFLSEDVEFTALAEVSVTVLLAALAQVIVEPEMLTIIYDEVVVFNATPIDTLGANVSDLEINWTVEGIAAANYTLNSTTGASVNFTANATGTAWVNATATYGGVTKNGTVVVNVIKEVPTMDITLTTRQQQLVVWTCTEPSSALYWGDLIIYLTDGTDTVNWSINTTGLDNGSRSVALYDPKMLGSDTIWLNITDELGNGVVNATDVIAFTTDGRFNPVKTYVVTIVFEPTSDQIVSRNFQGV